MAGEGCNLCTEHGPSTSTRWHLPGVGHGARGAPGGQQGLRLAETRQEPNGGCTEMENSQMQDLMSVILVKLISIERQTVARK